MAQWLEHSVSSTHCLSCEFDTRLVQDIQINIMFLPSERWDIAVSMLCSRCCVASLSSAALAYRRNWHCVADTISPSWRVFGKINKCNICAIPENFCKHSPSFPKRSPLSPNFLTKFSRSFGYVHNSCN